MGWESIDIPRSLIGENLVSGNGYRNVSRTQVFLPPTSQYAGYMFLHPTKLVSLETGRRVGRITYSEKFKFELIKRDREPGRKYKRYRLDVEEFLAIYRPLEEAMKARERRRAERQAEKETRMLGSVVFYTKSLYRNQHIMEFAFNDGEKFRGVSGDEIREGSGIQVRRVVAENISLNAFRSAAKELSDLQREVRALVNVLDALGNQSVTDEASVAKKAFLRCASEIEEKICRMAAGCLEKGEMSHEQRNVSQNVSRETSGQR